LVSSLYVSQQGCYVGLHQESAVVKQRGRILSQVRLPLLEQILIFGRSQVTTQLIRRCLWRNIPIAYLSRMGYCYGRLMPQERGYRQLARDQRELSVGRRLAIARAIVAGKLRNNRTILLRQQRRTGGESLAFAIQSLDYLSQQALQAETHDKVMGLEGVGSATYFSALGHCWDDAAFVFVARSRRPPGNPVNAMLSFGYQILWNHLLALIELQGLDPYDASLHQGSERHAALASDLVEEFRAPLIDSLVLYLINNRILHPQDDFRSVEGACYLNDAGRRQYLKAFLQRMEAHIQTDTDAQAPRWELLARQVKRYRDCVRDPRLPYQPYRIR